jgi:tRNA A-37 threonylcarbamoyl transferase component Bud32
MHNIIQKMYNIDKYNTESLRKIAKKMNIDSTGERDKLLKSIIDQFDIFEKEDKHDKYIKIKQLGMKGKEGITYLVKNDKGRRFAMKTFKKSKSGSSLSKEVELQKLAYKARVCPKVVDYNIEEKYIVMDVMDNHLYDYLRAGNILSERDQERLIEIYKKLDKAKVFHNDSNIMNYMYKKGKLMIIDFGFAKEINSQLCKKMNTDEPNMKIMPLKFVLKMKEYKIDPKSYNIILTHISREDRAKYGL